MFLQHPAVSHSSIVSFSLTLNFSLDFKQGFTSYLPLMYTEKICFVKNVPLKEENPLFYF